jgi:hypothetical protein
MPGFRCVPIPTKTAARFRATGRDDADNALIRRVASVDSPAPCRHCLSRARPGEAVLLGSYHLLAPLGVYWTPSPVFVHARDCPRYQGCNELPEIVRAAFVSVRAYDADQLCLYGLGWVGEGGEAEAALRRALADTRTSFVNIHTAKPGCLLTRVERLD